jgi:predicted nucleic acid-binding protein
MYALDTNAVIYYCGGELAAVSVLEPILFAQSVIVPAVVITELWSGKHTKQDEMKNVESFLETILVMAMDAHIAKSAGIIRRDHNLSIGDSIIAATALATNAILLTRNVRDFKRVPALVIEAV